ncbi:MAG: hypothetical protein EXR31_11000, partial [Betaproteobacteria bacterium]|nr:hypothetical protein [Betaproteobacteria bacterium]
MSMIGSACAQNSQSDSNRQTAATALEQARSRLGSVDVMAPALAAAFRIAEPTIVGELLRRVSVATLQDGQVFVLAPEGQGVSRAASGDVMVAPGRIVELSDLRWPNL